MAKPRKFTIEVDEGLYEDLKALVPWGSRTTVFANVLRLICDAAKQDGGIVIGAIQANQFRIIWKDPNASS